MASLHHLSRISSWEVVEGSYIEDTDARKVDKVDISVYKTHNWK